MPEHSIIAIANQKGGVGKTTTAINLGAALAQAGHETVLIDLDPQGNASTGLGIDADRRELSVYDLLLGDRSLEDVSQECGISGLSVVPATSDLASADVELSSENNRTGLLREKLSKISRKKTVLIDCPPALGLLTINAMVAANAVLVPLQAEFYALEGLSQLLTSIRHVRKTANPGLRVNGVLLTMTDYRNNLSQQVEADARATLGDLIYKTVIPRNVRVSEAPSFAQPVLIYDANSKGSIAYRSFAEEFIARLNLAPEAA